MKYCISYATDNNYVPHVAASLVSLFENNKKVLFNVYILTNSVSENHSQNLQTIANDYGQSISFISIDSLINKLSELNVAVNSLSISTYSRLFLAEILPDEIDKILYLDCDTIIVGNITDIWKHNITNLYIAGVIDTMYPNYKSSISLPLNKPYINAGILFINLEKWRNGATELFMDFIKKFDGKVPHLDQGVINGVFHDKEILELKFNVQTPVFLFNKYKNLLNYFSLTDYYSKKEFLEAKKNPVIIHYSSFFADRPWFSFCLHPKKNLYRKYLTCTPYFSNKLLSNKKSTFVKKIKSIFFVYAQSIYLKIR
jgi:lipopolysaccharide biosynthesis glycosyltransferase